MNTYDAVRTIFRSFQPPREGIACDLVYHPPQVDDSTSMPDLKPAFWTIRLYTDNFNSFDAEDRVVIFNWVSDIISTIRKIEPNCWVEKFERMPR